MQKLYEAKAVLRGLADVAAERTIDGETVLSEIREKYGLAQLKKDPGTGRGSGDLAAEEEVCRLLEISPE
jgi:hypothetical protein